MEDITLEKLMTNFNDIFQQLKDVTDPKEAMKALSQIAGLINGSREVTLDSLGGLKSGTYKKEDYDSILDFLLSKINNELIEKPGSMIKTKEFEITKGELKVLRNQIINNMSNYSGKDDADSKIELSELEEQFNLIDKWYKTLTDTDPDDKKVKVSFKDFFDLVSPRIVDTKKIRRELMSRTEQGKIKTDDFETFFTEGIALAEQKYNDSKTKREELEKELENVYKDNDAPDLRSQLNSAKNDADRIKICENIRKKFANDSELKKHLAYKRQDGRRVIKDFSADEVKDIADVNTFINHILTEIDNAKGTAPTLDSAYNNAIKDNEAENLRDQLDKAIEKKDAQKKIEICEKIRQKLYNNSKFSGLLELKDENGNNIIDFMTDNNAIADEKNADYLIKVLKQIDEKIDEYADIMNEQEENKLVFERELEIIGLEKDSLIKRDAMFEKDLSDPSGKTWKMKKTVHDELLEEVELRKKQIEVSMNGDEEFQKKWNETVQRFVKCRDASDEKDVTLTYTDSDGNTKDITVKCKTIDESKYPTNDKEENGPKATTPAEQYEADIHFLNINEYKTYLELISIFDNLGKDADGKDTLKHEEKINLMEQLVKQKSLEDSFKDLKLYSQYREKEIEQKGSGKKWLEAYLNECKEYVDTFHGFTNDYNVQYSTLLTAGSTLKDLKPVNKDLPAKTNVKNALINVGRFFGWRTPHLFIKNEKGERKFNPKAIGNLLTDVAVVGGMAAVGIAGAIAAPVGSAAVLAGVAAIAKTYGVYYGVKGFVVGTNRLDARRIYKAHENDIKNNLPTLRGANRREREVARRNYYMRNGKGPFLEIRSWAKAKFEKYFAKGKAEETEKEIIKEKVKASESSIFNRVERALDNVKKAEKNQKIREENLQKEVRSSITYNDIERDASKLDVSNDDQMKEAVKKAALNAALHSNGKRKIITINDQAQSDYRGKYVQGEDVELTRTQKITEAKIKGDSEAIPVLTISEKYKAEQETRDLKNRVLTAILTIGTKGAIDSIRNSGFWKQQTNYDTKDHQFTYTSNEPQPKAPEIASTNTAVPSQPTPTETPNIDFSSSISDLTYGKERFLHTFKADVYDTLDLPKGSSIDGFAISYVDPNGNQFGLSIGEGASHFTSEHVQTVLQDNVDMSNWSLDKILNTMVSENPEAYKAYLKATGLPENTDIKDLFLKTLENPEKYGKAFGQSGVTGWREFIAPIKNKIVQSVSKGTQASAVQANEATDIAQTLGSTAESATKHIDYSITTARTETLLDTVAINDSVKEAVATAGLATGAENLHEAFDPTYKKNPGTFEENNPNISGQQKKKDDEPTKYKLGNSKDGRSIDDDEGR